MRNLTLASGVWSYKIGSSYTAIKSPDGKRTNHPSWLVAGVDVPSWENMKHHVLFAWTGKVPTLKQLQPAVLFIKEEFGFDFTFPEYPPSPQYLAIAKRFGQEFEGSGASFEGSGASFEGSEEDIQRVMKLLDLLGFGCRVRIEECTYDGYLKPEYYLYSERGAVHCGLKAAESQIQQVLDPLPIRDQKILLASLLKQASKKTKS